MYNRYTKGLTAAQWRAPLYNRYTKGLTAALRGGAIHCINVHLLRPGVVAIVLVLVLGYRGIPPLARTS